MTATACIKQTPDGSVLLVLAVVRASRTEIIDLHQERCRIRVKGAPVDGEANAELASYLAKLFGLTKKQVVLKQGQSNRQKAFLLCGLEAERAIEIVNDTLNRKVQRK